MIEFVRAPINYKSINRRTLVHGNGVNDAWYITKYRIEGKEVLCPYYSKWVGMLNRCYSNSYHRKKPTYMHCSVSSEWLLFSNFLKWMECQNWKGMELDKDLLVYGNKVYSKETCMFIPKEINQLIYERTNNRGLWPKGVSYSKRDKSFIASFSLNNKTKSAGSFSNPIDAEIAYKKSKSDHIKMIANNYKHDNKLYKALIMRAELIVSPS